MTTPLDTHKTLYHTLSARYGQEWPRAAILQISHTFALTYGELPTEPSFRHAWCLPSKQAVLKVYTWGVFRADLLAAYPYLAELALWGTEVHKPLVTVTCLGCGQPYQTRNKTKWRLHTQCRERETEDCSDWMNQPMNDVRNYDTLVMVAQVGQNGQRRGRR